MIDNKLAIWLGEELWSGTEALLELGNNAGMAKKATFAFNSTVAFNLVNETNLNRREMNRLYIYHNLAPLAVQISNIPLPIPEYNNLIHPDFLQLS